MQGENLIIQQGDYGNTRMMKSAGNIPDGEYFVFLNPNTGESFYCTSKFNPTQPNEFPIPSTLYEVADGLNNIAEFAQFYNAVVTLLGATPLMTISTSSYFNTDWNITRDNLPLLMSNFFGENDGHAPIYVEDYSIVGTLFFIDTAGDQLELTKFELIPDIEMKAEVKLGILLKDYIKKELPNIINPEFYKDFPTKYRVQFAEKYRVDDELKTFISVTKDYFAFRGKIPFTKFPEFDLITFSSGEKNFLSWIDFNIYLWTNTHFYLNYFLRDSPIYDTYLHAIIYYTDRTSEEVSIPTVQFGGGSIFQLPCSVKDLNLTQYSPSKTIFKYQLALVIGTSAVMTKWMTFFLIDKPLYARQFTFLNSFGVWEFFQTKGKQTEKLKTKRSEYKRDITIGYAASDAEIVSDIEESSNLFELETGSITKMEAQNLSNMFDSPFLFEIIDDKYIRCQLVAGTTDIVPEDEDLFSVKFSYRYAFDR